MNLKHFYNRTQFPLTIAIVVTGQVTSQNTMTGSHSTSEVTHKFGLNPGQDCKLEYGTLECCFIKAINLSYEVSGIRYQSNQEVISPEAELAGVLNAGSYIAITQVSPPAFESDA